MFRDSRHGLFAQLIVIYAISKLRAVLDLKVHNRHNKTTILS
jgi:hypothetical protein